MDLADYIQNVVHSSSSAAMRRWRLDDRKLVIETLTERADGMFRWLFFQLEALRHCFPPNLRRFTNELPDVDAEREEYPIFHGFSRQSSNEPQGYGRSWSLVSDLPQLFFFTVETEPQLTGVQ